MQYLRDIQWKLNNFAFGQQENNSKNVLHEKKKTDIL